MSRLRRRIVRGGGAGTGALPALYCRALVGVFRWRAGMFRPAESVAEFLPRLAGDRLALSPAEIDAVLEAADSFDFVEFLLQIERASKNRRQSG